MNQLTNESTEVQPADLSRTFENAIQVYQGQHDRLPELLKNAGSLLLKASRKLTTTQLVLAVGVLAVGVILVTQNIADKEHQKTLQHS